MDFELWLTFIVAYTVISIIPGPSVFMVTSQALTRGTRAAFYCIFGDVLAGVVLVALSLFGVGAVLATSATLFLLVKWAGVFYMAFLGISQIRSARQTTSAIVNPLARGSMWAGFLTGILNPKAIIFYMAFLSQFMDPDGDILLQFTILVPTATVVVWVVLSGYVLMAARARQVFQSETARRRFGYTGGGFLIGGSFLLAAKG